MNDHLIAFLKNPLPGTVKTRLQVRYTPEQAARVYRGFILDCLATYRSVKAALYIAEADPPGAEEAVRRLIGPGWTVRAQARGDLGVRMASAFERSFAGGAAHAVLLGTDLPSLPAQYVRQAFHLLAEKDLVLGPSTDGGYYLIGLRKPAPDLFRDIPWSTGRVLSRTLDRAAGLGLGLLPPWYDVDTPEELDLLLAHTQALERAGARDLLRHTRQALSEIRAPGPP